MSDLTDIGNTHLNVIKSSLSSSSSSSLSVSSSSSSSSDNDDNDDDNDEKENDKEKSAFNNTNQENQNSNQNHFRLKRKHKKSKNGCSVCKSRRIKCDQTIPACINCTHKDITCPYLSMTPYQISRIIRENN
ncbi:hypothetical protein C6P42_002963, partial [Pichia californica]